MWSAALPLGLEGKMAALQAALEFIGTPPPPVASARTGRSCCSTLPRTAFTRCSTGYHMTAALRPYPDCAHTDYSPQCPAVLSRLAVVNVTWAVTYCRTDHMKPNMLTVAHDVTQVRQCQE